jgi:tetratricopeptide (TPR) repeat protein
MTRQTLKFLALLALLLVIAAPSLAQNKKQRDQAKKLQDLGDQSAATKNYADAVDKYGQSLAIIATNPYVHYRKGFAHFELKQYPDALTEFNTALSQGFGRPLEIYRARIYIYLEQKDYDNAIADSKAAMALEPRNPAFIKALVEGYLGKNDNASALELLQKSSSVAPDDPDIDYYLARLYAGTNDSKDEQAHAEAALRKGVRLVGETYYLLGDAYQRQHNWTGAIDAFTRSISAKPDNLAAYRNLTESYRSDGRYTEAINLSAQGLKVFPQNADLYTDMSWFYSLADRSSEAIGAAKAAVQIAPQAYLGYTNLCRAYNDNKQYDLAIQACNSALRLQPGDGETYFYLGRAMNLAGKTTEATKMYSLAVKGLEDYVQKLPDYSDGWYLLGNAYFADNQRDKALDAYVKCLELSPKYVKAHYNLAQIYIQKRMKTQAQEQYAALQKLDPKVAELLKAEIDKM